MHLCIQANGNKILKWQRMGADLDVTIWKVV